MRSKKAAAGHVEIIISFLIFITFVVFLLVFVNPIEKNKDKEYYLEMTEKALMEYLEVDMTLFSIGINQQALLDALAVGSCVCIDYDYPSKVIGRDENEDLVPARTIGSYICIQPDAASPKRFYKLYFSGEFTENPGVCTGSSDPIINEPDYTLGVINQYKKVSNQRVNALNAAYATDASYETFRTDTLKLNNYFNVEIKTTAGEVLASGKILDPKESDILAKDIPIEIIKADGEIIPAIMNIQVWD